MHFEAVNKIQVVDGGKPPNQPKFCQKYIYGLDEAKSENKNKHKSKKESKSKNILNFKEF